jgi:hypothetical protein
MGSTIQIPITSKPELPLSLLLNSDPDPDHFKTYGRLVKGHA